MSADPAAGRATTCPRCGDAFACGVDGGGLPCFCTRILLGDDRLAELRAKWSDCLCATCLATLSDHPELPA